MKACKCDICGTYMDRTAVGVLYDNTTQADRKRYDFCDSCLKEVLALAEEIKADAKR